MILSIILIIVAILVGLGVGFALGEQHRKKTAEATIGSANQEATRILNQALAMAEQKRKESVLEAKDEIHRHRQEVEKELRDRRNEVQRQERRMNQKEENLDKKSDNLERKEENLVKKLKEAEQKQAEIEEVKKNQVEILEKISGFTEAQAKDYILAEVDEKLDREKATKILEAQEQIKDQSDEMARRIVTTAIQRCAAERTTEATVSVVQLPNDEMKGRIIGREGRNIRAIEAVTGVDLIIDDTPETITISCFEPVRREIARLTMERLIQDGRIHPARIEETYEKCKKEVNQTIKQTGERAVLDAGVTGIHPELVKLLGRLKYRTSYGQNVLDHSLEVCYFSGLIASEIGADVKQAKRAGLLHDIGKAIDHEMEGSHVQLGADAAKKYRESEPVVHAIRAHHGDVEPKTTVAFIVQAADAISAARPGARRENIENYIKRLEKLEEIANSFDGVDNSFAIQAGREIRIMVKPEKISDDQMVILAHDVAQRIEEELEYPGQIKIHVVRESRVMDYAK
ncbi:MAG: ribonuclease Y [Oscillospiraceae bacterium]|nr:ribonuclease Y [Oscillospiraceae bacterium]